MVRPIKCQLQNLHLGFQDLFGGEPLLRKLWQSQDEKVLAHYFVGTSLYQATDIVLASPHAFLRRWLDEATPQQLSTFCNFVGNTPGMFVCAFRIAICSCDANSCKSDACRCPCSLTMLCCAFCLLVDFMSCPVSTCSTNPICRSLKPTTPLHDSCTSDYMFLCVQRRQSLAM